MEANLAISSLMWMYNRDGGLGPTICKAFQQTAIRPTWRRTRPDSFVRRLLAETRLSRVVQKLRSRRQEMRPMSNLFGMQHESKN
jgi:hypothetical protein